MVFFHVFHLYDDAVLRDARKGYYCGMIGLRSGVQFFDSVVVVGWSFSITFGRKL